MRCSLPIRPLKKHTQPAQPLNYHHSHKANHYDPRQKKHVLRYSEACSHFSFHVFISALSFLITFSFPFEEKLSKDHQPIVLLEHATDFYSQETLTDQQMVRASVFIILIYQLVWLQNIWYLVRSTKELTHGQQPHPLTTSQTAILHKTNTKNKVAGKISVQPDSQCHRCQCDGPAKQTERQPDPPASTADLPSRQAYRQSHQCNMVDFPRTQTDGQPCQAARLVFQTLTN